MQTFSRKRFAPILALTALLFQLGGCSDRGRDFGLGPPGTLHAITIVGGPVFYGFLDRTTSDAVVLNDVYYVQIATDPQSNQRVNKLVRRAETDWHGPEKMSIPYDKIVLVEIVGANSTVAKLISDARSKAAPAAQKK